MPQALPGSLCQQLRRLSRATTESSRGPKEAGTKRMALARIMASPSHAPAARVESPQALPGFQCPHLQSLVRSQGFQCPHLQSHAQSQGFGRLPNPTVLPLLRRNAKQETHIDYGFAESIRNAPGNDRLRSPMLNTRSVNIRMTSRSVIGTSYSR